MRWWWLVCVAGCEPDPKAGSDTGGDGCGVEPIALTDAHRTTWSGALDVQTVPVASESDITVCWDDLTTDVRGRAVDPGDVPHAFLSGLTVPKEEALTKLLTNTLNARDTALWYDVDLPAGATCMALSDLSVVGNPLYPEEVLTADSATWMVVLTRPGWLGRTEYITAVELVPTPGEATTHVVVTDDSARLTVDADLTSAPPITACAGAVSVDWSALTVDAFGVPMDSGSYDTLVVVHDPAPLDEVQDRFLTFTDTATTWSRTEPGRTDAPLDGPGAPRTADDRPFPGFFDEGTWLIGVLCQTCPSPMPGFLGVVEAER